MPTTGMQFSHAVGYRGFCKLRGTILLCTGGSISLTQEPIMGSGVWGAGYKVATPISYAWNYLQIQGNASYELTKPDTASGGSGDGAMKALQEFVNNDRTSASPIILLPDGANGFNGNGWMSSVSFEASQGGPVTGSFNFKGDPDPQDNGGSDAGLIAGNAEETGAEVNSSVSSVESLKGATLFPYWNTYVNIGDTTGMTSISNILDTNQNMIDVINWNFSGNSDLQLLKCCNKYAPKAGEKAPLRADYILAGQLSGDASITVFKIKGQFKPKDYHQPLKQIKFYLDDNNYVSSPQLILNSASTSMTTGASYVSAEFSYNALGDGVNALFGINQ